MTSFLALRASVCAYLWCLIPSVCYIGFELESSFTISAYLAGSLLARREVPSSKPDRPLYFLFTPERAQFCLGAPTNSKSCPHAQGLSNGEVCPRLRILPFLFCSTTQGFLLFYLSLDSPSQVPLLLRYSDSLPRLSHLGPAFSFLILHSRFLRFLSDSLGQPEPIPDSAPPSRFSCLSSYS